MTKVTHGSVFALAFLNVALFCCSCTRIAPDVESHIGPKIGSQRIGVQRLSRQLGASCQSNEDCGDSQSCFDGTSLCENPPCNGNCLPKVNLCSCDEPCSGDFEGFQCFRLARNGESFSNICLDSDDVPTNLINVFQSAIDIEPLVCDGTDGSDDVDTDNDDDADNDDGSDNGDEGNETGSASESSESSNGTENDTSEPVCIEASMLTNFGSHELVFEKHVLAHVLCDMAGSCATKGHMVMYKDKAMMMKSYCDIVGCDEKIMMVNSPRYQRGLKVKSKSEDMHFTAFAARYETRGEEMVLSVAARYGF